MKGLAIGISMMLAVLATVQTAKAQILDATDVAAAAGNLVNIQIAGTNVNVTAIDVVDVTNVLNNNDVQALNNILNNVTVTLDDVLTNTLQNAEIIKDNQIVVGLVVNLLGEAEQVLVTQRRRR